MDTDTIFIARITTTDWQILQQIARETFTETFSSHNTVENMRKYVDVKFNKDQVKTELANPDSHFFIASINKKAIGYLKLNVANAQTELQEDTGIEIERIYVTHAYHGHKIGQMLYEKAVAIGRQLQKQYIWLAVWEENKRAIRFYEKNGFIAFDKHIFKLGDEAQTDIMMKKIITTD